MPEHSVRKVEYADKAELMNAILNQNPPATSEKEAPRPVYSTPRAAAIREGDE